MPAIAGLRGTGDWGADERPTNFREMILWLNPNGMTPIFGLMAKVAKRTTDDPEFKWWVEPNDIIRLQVNGALTASDTTITVDSSDPSASALDARYGTATNLKPGDILMVEPSTDSATFNPEMIEVVSPISATQVVVRRGVAGTTAGNIADNANLLLVGSAYAQGSGAPKSVSRNPVQFSNYCQIFKETYELTGTADKTKTRTGPAWSNDKKRAIFRHSLAIEMAILFGKKAIETGTNGKPKYFMGGLRDQLPTSRQSVFGAALTVNGFIDAVYDVFDFDTPAGNSRIAFCGNGALNVLNKTIHSDPNSDISFAGVTKVFGMDLQTFVLPQGTIALKTHPLLNRHPLYTNSMFVLDFSALKYVAMRDRDTKIQDDVQAKDEDVRRGLIQTECSFMLDYGGLTCKYLGGFTT